MVVCAVLTVAIGIGLTLTNTNIGIPGQPATVGVIE